MYMNSIGEVDEEWDFHEELVAARGGDDDSDDSDEGYDEEDLEEMCLNKFHRWRTLQKLHVCL